MQKIWVSSLKFQKTIEKIFIAFLELTGTDFNVVAPVGPTSTPANDTTRRILMGEPPFENISPINQSQGRLTKIKNLAY